VKSTFRWWMRSGKSFPVSRCAGPTCTDYGLFFGFAPMCRKILRTDCRHRHAGRDGSRNVDRLHAEHQVSHHLIRGMDAAMV
jgi:hypothetical protein